MNMIKKKIICLALSLVLVMGASQAQAWEVSQSFSYVYNHGASICTIAKGVCLGVSCIPYPYLAPLCWSIYGVLGAGESIYNYHTGKISIIEMSCEMLRNIGIGLGWVGGGNLMQSGWSFIRSAGAMGVSYYSNNPLKRTERMVEGSTYFVDTVSLINANQWGVGKYVSMGFFKRIYMHLQYEDVRDVFRDLDRDVKKRSYYATALVEECLPHLPEFPCLKGLIKVAEGVEGLF
jgi:hypothetical protein